MRVETRRVGTRSRETRPGRGRPTSVLVALALVACGAPDTPIGADASTDGSMVVAADGASHAPGEAGVDGGPGADASESPLDAGVPADARVPVDAGPERDWPVDTGAWTPEDVEACEASGAALAEACDTETDRVCATRAYASRCATEDPRAFGAAFECMRPFSEGLGCVTLGDTAGADVCIERELDRFVDVARGRLAERIARACAADVRYILYRDRAVAALGPDTTARVAACVAETTSCEEAIACVDAELADVIACYRS